MQEECKSQPLRVDCKWQRRAFLPALCELLTITMSRSKVRISGKVLVRSSASDTPLKRSTFLLTLKVSVIFSCLPFDLVGFSFLAAGFLGCFGSVALAFLFLPPFLTSETQQIYFLNVHTAAFEMYRQTEQNAWIQKEIKQKFVFKI